MLESIERVMTFFREVSRSIFLGQPGQWDCDVGIIKDKLVVEVCEAQD